MTDESAPKNASTSPSSEIILINAIIEPPLLQLVRDQTASPTSSHVTVVLCTTGGDPHSGYRIGRLLQNRYERVTILLAGPCKSTGTLIAMAAHELVMSDSAELGPLDVQLWKRGEILGAELTSSSILFQALGRVTLEAQALFRQHLFDMCVNGGLPTDTAAPVAAAVITGLLSPIFAQMDPHQLGEVARANDIGLHYAHRLGKHSQNLKDGTPALLAWSYPDHGFVIDRAEAQDLFSVVRAPTEVESKLIEQLQAAASDPGVGIAAPVVQRLWPPPQNHEDTAKQRDPRSASMEPPSRDGEGGMGDSKPVRLDMESKSNASATVEPESRSSEA